MPRRSPIIDLTPPPAHDPDCPGPGGLHPGDLSSTTRLLRKLREPNLGLTRAQIKAFAMKVARGGKPQQAYFEVLLRSDTPPKFLLRLVTPELELLIQERTLLLARSPLIHALMEELSANPAITMKVMTALALTSIEETITSLPYNSPLRLDACKFKMGFSSFRDLISREPGSPR